MKNLSVKSVGDTAFLTLDEKLVFSNDVVFFTIEKDQSRNILGNRDGIDYIIDKLGYNLERANTDGDASLVTVVRKR